MAFPTFTMRQLLEAGAHFGHQTRRWNPAMEPYIYGTRNGVHILDLTQTVPMMHRAMMAARDVVAGGGRVLFVGTKRQAQDPVAQAAKRCGQYYVNHRWLGGMLTNWKTISFSIRRLRELETRAQEGGGGLTKKEMLQLDREREKLERALGGIKDMGGLPDMLFVIDTNKEAIAVQEANKLNIPVIAVCDSNSDPKGIRFPFPGNDDASRAINLYCDLLVGAVLDGIHAEMAASGMDMGSVDDLPGEGDLGPIEPMLPGDGELTEGLPEMADGGEFAMPEDQALAADHTAVDHAAGEGAPAEDPALAEATA